MTDDDLGGCDNRYRAASCVWGVDPDPVLDDLAAKMPLDGARVLDAGCGEGRHAAFLARQGASVLATDVSRLAVDRARALFPDPAIQWECADLRALRPPASSFDGVLLSSVVHWLRDETEVASVLRHLQAATKPGGWHALSAFNARHAYVRTTSDTRDPCLLPHDWFLARYDGWDLVRVSDTELTHEHTGHEERHTHAITELIAVRR
jgi:2-polyprenyl-3-methyl-5-hydroxy-6-metoxy-1,4-benzoquinol methylase